MSVSPEQQRIAIAEWCGWTLMDIADGTKFSNPEEPLIVQRWVNKELGLVSRKLPDYLNDLNAMHEAEKGLDEMEASFTCNLATIVKSAWLPDTGMQAFRLTHATAAQRAEALLRTIGKWVET